MSADPYETARRAQALAVQRRKRRQARSHRPPAPTPASDGKPPPGSPTQQQGYTAETRAGDYLCAQGLSILASNLRCRAGEIDLIAREGDMLVFVEVRQRRNTRFGGAAASVNRRKQARLIRAACYFLPRLAIQHFGGLIPACRFDVVCFDESSPRWIPDAFQA